MSASGSQCYQISFKLWGEGNALKSSACRSPLGTAAFVSIACFQDNSLYELIVIGVMLAVLTAYYYAHAQHEQVLSNKERSILSVAIGPGHHIRAEPQASTSTSKTTGNIHNNHYLDGSFQRQTPRASISEADSSFSSNGSGPVIRFSSGSMRQSVPELVEAGHRLTSLLKEHPKVADSGEKLHTASRPRVQEEGNEDAADSREAESFDLAPQQYPSSETHTAAAGIPGQRQHHGNLGIQRPVKGGGWKHDLKSGIWPCEKPTRGSRGRAKR